ncbi:hypothetical protein CQ009_08810 [Pseudomonas sp. MYb2]|nr:hypothetical protein CQ025_01580 [Pseudomonas sp. MYb3]PRC35613.1 hypothetical protein CQ009_08810 [Pseudomonas sp. MYb2]
MARASLAAAVNKYLTNTKNPLWERACSRRGRHIQHRCRLIHRFREQARSHRVLDSARTIKVLVRTNPCKPNS